MKSFEQSPTGGSQPEHSEEILAEFEKYKSVLELTPEEFLSVFTDRAYSHAFADACRLAVQHRREAGFSVLRNKENGKMFYTPASGGEQTYETNLKGGEELLRQRNKEYRDTAERADEYMFSSFHIHNHMGHTGDVAAPSVGDMHAHFGRTTFAPIDDMTIRVSPVEIVVNVTGDRSAEGIAFSHTDRFNPVDHPHMAQEFDDAIDALGDRVFAGQATQEEVIEELRHYGVKAVAVAFSEGELTEESRKAIVELNPKLRLDTERTERLEDIE